MTSFQSESSLMSNRKIKVFLFFLVLTSIIWLLIELSKTYTTVATFSFSYKNIPTEKLLQNSASTEMEVAFRAPGFTVLNYKIRKRKLKLDLSNTLKSTKGHYILPNNQISELNSQLPGSIELVGMLQDTVFVSLGINKSKKVPVISSVEINFKLGFNFTEEVTIAPDSIVINGPEQYIDSVHEVHTDFIKLDEVYENVDLSISLIKPKNLDNVVYSTEEVTLNGSVDKFTEGSFKIPVVIINQPQDIRINPFPKEIEVVYQVGLSNFNKINESSFQIVFDYDQYKKDTLLQYLSPVIKQKNDLISSLKINPSQVEFLIQRN